ncbi:MAG TPA: serine hydrolase [Asticcacaulis sp.]|nr:serine hydrolase [Asticcacaulis sp.]
MVAQQPRPVAAPVQAPPPTGAPATFPQTMATPAVPLRPVAPAAPLPMPIPVHPTSTPIDADDIETFTDSVVRAEMQRDHVLGVTVAVVQGNTPLLLKGYGYDRLSRGRRVDPNNSLFRLGSITKVFTWIVARQELEAGRIKLDDPIANSVPTDIFAENRSYKPLSLRVLMDHTAGFEDTGLGHLFQLNSNRIVGVDSYFRRHTPRRERQPGLYSSYSNFGPALAAQALAHTAMARDVPSLMEARIFQPLGMDHTSLREPYMVPNPNVEDLPAPLSEVLTQDLSDGYVWDGATYKAQPFDHALPLSGALGGSSTAHDMSRLMSLMLAGGQLDGVQLFNSDSATAFHTPMLNMPEGYNGWASGLMIRTAPSGYVTYGHGGSTLWFNSNLVLVPDLNLGIFISTNTQTGGPLADSFPNLLLDHLSGDIVRPPLMPTPEQAYAQHRDYYDGLKGQYVSTRRAYGGLEGAITRLLNTVEVGVDTDGRLILTTRNGLSAYVPASAQGFFNPQDSEDSGPSSATGGLHFLSDANGGRVKSFETAANMARYERIGWVHSPDVVKTLTWIMVITCLATLGFLAKGTAKHERPTEEQARATIISCGLSVLWLVAILLFNHWYNNLSDDATDLFTHWPSRQLDFASMLAALATLGTGYQVATYYFVYSENMRYHEGWPQWQKYAHGALLAYWVFYAVVIELWGGLEFWG